MNRRGQIARTWDDSFKDLEYLYLPNKDHDVVENWLAQGYPNHLVLNGAVHNLRNQVPQYVQPLCDQLALKDVGCQLYRMSCGDIVPIHCDHYMVYKQIVGIAQSSQIYRVVVFMEDWKSGHYFEIDGEPWVGWHAGDYVIWNNDVPHMAANVGVAPRYTLQITGWL